MQIQSVTFRGIVLGLLFSVTILQGAVAAQQTGPSASTEAAEPAADSTLTISDLISYSTELSGRLSALQRELQLGFDLAGFEEALGETTEELKSLSARLKATKTDRRLGLGRLSELKAEAMASGRKLQERWKPLANRIKQVERWRNEWSVDKERLLALESSLPGDESSKTVRPTIARAKEAIDKATKLISDNLNSLLATENQAAGVQATADSLVADIDGLLQALRGDLFQKSAPSMFSSEYFGQFNTALWDDLGKGLEFVHAFRWGVIQKNVIVLQVALWLIIAIIIMRNRSALAAEPHLIFIAKRPFSTGLLIAIVVSFFFYEIGRGAWRLVDFAVGGICLARLSGCLIAGTWRRRAVYGFVLVLIINEFLKVFDFPQPLSRLFVLVVSLIGLFLCLWRVLNRALPVERRDYRWALWGGVLVYGMMVVANVSGYSVLAAHLLEASFSTVLLFLLGWLLMISGRGGLEWVLKSGPATRVPVLEKSAPVIVRVSSRLLKGFVVAFLTMYLLVAWGFYDNGFEAFRSVMSMGFSIGSWQANVGVILAAFLCLYGALLISRTVQSILAEAVFPRRGVDRGAQLSMARLVHYAILLIGFLLALGILGVNFTNITIIGGALGVGIGFGLQTIVNNFVSGLILLFERPVRVGDYVEVEGMLAEIKKIGLRATIVETFDRADMVIPNSDLISNRVTNWTRTNRIVRLRIPVGVAYGSDVALVMKILLDCAQDNPSVMSSPEPQALFRGFGDSSLDFELRVFLSNVDHRLIVHSELLQDIDEQFRLNGVEIPFPQRDLHLRSIDEEAGTRLLGKDLPGSSKLDEKRAK
ncbi:MAG: mechanosensitive ion channel [Syntrophobacterales bacterium]|jgi:small-conductance mechanosensitive channel